MTGHPDRDGTYNYDCGPKTKNWGLGLRFCDSSEAASCKHYLTTPEDLCLQITPERYARNLQRHALTEKLRSISIRAPWLGKHALKSKAVCIM